MYETSTSYEQTEKRKQSKNEYYKEWYAKEENRQKRLEYYRERRRKLKEQKMAEQSKVGQ